MENLSEAQCSALDILEHGMHFHVKTKIMEFSSFLNSTARISLINSGKDECEEYVFLLLTLKKTIKEALSQLGKSYKRQADLYQCGECNQLLPIEFGADTWSILQNHEHFEQLYVKFLNGNLQTVPFVTNGPSEEVGAVPGSSHAHLNSSSIENNDNDIEQPDLSMDEDSVPNNSILLEDEEEYGSNNFRFNFKLSYDPSVASKLYPDSLMKTVRRIDRFESYSIQRAGPSRAVCLLCCCDLMARGSRVSKSSIMDHVMGQRHLKFSASSECLDAAQAYHEAFVNFDIGLQAHQVYFKPESIHKARCVICEKSVEYDMVPHHIFMDKHRLIVLDFYKKNANVVHLANIQVQVYGIKEEPTDTNQKGGMLGKENATVKHTGQKKGKSESDSSSPSDAKEEHHLVKSVENLRSPYVKDWIPYRYTEHLQFLIDKGNIMVCRPCQMNVAKNADALRKHIRLVSHQQLSSKPLARYTYYCEICNLNFPEETAFMKHLAGPNTHSNMAESRKSKTTEYECTNCRLVIYGDDLSLLRHVRKRTPVKEKRTDKKETQLPDQVRRMFATVEVIEAISQKLCEEANDNLTSNQLTKECCAKLEAALSPTFGRCQAFPFGSRISGLGNERSDLDVFIDIGDMYTGRRDQDPVKQSGFVRKAAATLLKHKDEFKDVLSVSTARTPIVKLFHKRTNIECDLSFKHGLSVENTMFIRLCIDLQPITQPFILMLKRWSSYNTLDEHITTYAMAILAIFYLQVNNYLLSVKELRKLNPVKTRTICGWETINYTMPVAQMRNHVTPYEHSITRLLKDFFDYYSKFNYDKNVVCPLLGYTITKDRFNGNGDKLPPEMRSYVQQLNGRDPEQFRSMSPFCIQDPFDLSHNLTKACQPGTVNRFKAMCDLSWRHLKALK